MKKLVLMFSLMMVAASASASPVKPLPVAGGGVSSVGYGLVIGAVVLAASDKVQACDSLPVKSKKAANGNYSFTVAGCEYSDVE